MSKTEALEKNVVKAMHIDAPREIVFELLTDARRMPEWMGTAVELDPRPGGIYRCHVHGEAIAGGEFVEVIKPERVVYTFGWEGSELIPPGATRVEFDLKEENGGTLLTLTHLLLPNDELRAKHTEGWTHYCDRLAQVASGNNPGPDPWATDAEKQKHLE